MDNGKYGRVIIERDIYAILGEGWEERAEGLFIPSDEPLFLLRGKDAATVGTIASYADRCKALGSPAEHVMAAERFGGEILRWQGEHREIIRAGD